MKKNTKYNEINVRLQKKKIWSTIKPFLTNKCHINWEEKILKFNNETIVDISVLVDMFSSHYKNIVEKTSGKKPSHFARANNVSGTMQATYLSAQLCWDHSSINRIKTTSKNQILSITSSNNVCGTNPEEIFKFLSVLGTKEAVSFDMIPPKFVKMAESVLCQLLWNSINDSLSKGIFPEDAKIAMVQLQLSQFDLTH